MCLLGRTAARNAKGAQKKWATADQGPKKGRCDSLWLHMATLWPDECDCQVGAPSAGGPAELRPESGCTVESASAGWATMRPGRTLGPADPVLLVGKALQPCPDRRRCPAG
ncbi:hypothetical protein NDU88_001417 [Pleurodeles waltl]|uniref:Uncharacterized protein n=1 Tax=Pleurodeles waltl TaxID=8319 RepID=A0AAV7P7V2_PLEWA|nr:hypothetical protein NDU88_001417 [Pleurodeles waltl]